MSQPNLSYINKLADGDEEFSKNLIDIIRFEFPKEVNLYLENMRLGNYEQAAKGVHKIKHKISILSFEKGYELADQHEINLINGNNVFEIQFNEVLSSLTNFLKLI